METMLLIDNADVAAQHGATFLRRHPISDAVVTTAAAATVADARAAADAGAKALPEWSAIGPTERRRLLMKAADIMDARTDLFVQAMRDEIGATSAWAAFNTRLAAGLIREAAALTTQIGGEVIPSDRPGCLAMSVREPAGVVLGIAPWNAPLILGVRAVAMPLACGNTVVMKASEITPRTHRMIGEVFRDAGLKPGVINVVTNAPADAGAIVEALIAHPAVRRINFTGSTRVGRIIAETAGRYLKPVLLELGGKAPLLILDDADIDEAVNAAAFGAFMNQGQICMSTERIVVHASIADAFVERLAAKARSLSTGDPRQGDVAIGSLVGREPAERVMALLADAVANGAVVQCGGALDGTIMQATVIDQVAPSMKLYHEESFGPLASIVRVNSDDEAVAVANDTEYGLSAAIFTRDIARGLGLAKRIKSGICHINGPTVHDEAQMPFGGTKASGYGRFGGKAGIDQFTELRWITIETKPVHYPF